MGTKVQWVRYGPPAARALRDAVRAAKEDAPLAPVSVVVPSNHVGVAARRLLASGRLGPLCARGTGIAAVGFLTVYRLAELLGASELASRGRRPVSTPLIAAALRSALAERPGVFAPVADHPSTEMALVAAYRELRDLSPAALEALDSRGRRAADVVRLCRAARGRLEPGWYDEEDLMDVAVEVLHTGGASPGASRAEMGAVVAYLPQRVTRHAAALLGAVASSGDLLVLAGTTGDARADSEVTLTLRRLASGGDGSVPTSEIGPLDVVGTSRTRIVTTSDADEEVRSAVRAVIGAVREGTPLERIAILHASPEPYARLVHEQLAAADIAHNGVAVMPLTARVAGRTLLGWLRLPQGGFRREDVLAWLVGARLHHEGGLVPVAAWERLSREAGVVAGREDWDERLERYARDCDADADRIRDDPEAPEWREERLRGDATRVRELRAFAIAVIDDLVDAASALRTWDERSQWTRGRLRELIGDERRRAAWPAVEVRAAERVERAIDRLGSLDAVEGPVGLDVFSRTLELELDADLGRVGRMGEGVLVGSVAMGVGLDLDLAIVLGLAEGSFPAPVREDSLLPDREREVAGGELSLRAHGVERQHRQLLASLAGASRQLLCVPRGDLRRTTERVPSRWVLEVASAMAGERWWSDDLIRTERDWLEQVASHDAGLRRVGFPATAQEYRLRALMAANGPRHGRPSADVLDDPVFAAGATVVVARRSAQFTRFDGNLAGLPVPSPVQRATSATRLQGWARCPFAYYLQFILGVEEVEKPEDRLWISPIDVGSLVHEALETFIAGVLARPAAEQPSPRDAWSPADAARLREIAESLFASYEGRGLTGRRIFWEREQHKILADLERFLHVDSEQRAGGGTRPVAAELPFGLPGGALGPVALYMPDGRSVRFRGKADRVNLATDGTVEVVDYKTGSRNGYEGLNEQNPDKGGTRLQLPIYGLAAREHQRSPDARVRAEYWFVSKKGEFKRIGYPITVEVLERVGSHVGTVVAGIESGAFPNYPTATSTSPWVECAFCDPDGLGVADLRRRFDRKRADPALVGFLTLVEPDAEADERPEERGEGDAGEKGTGGSIGG